MKSCSKTINDVIPCSTFKEFVEKICLWYGDAIAFRNYDNSWSYYDLYCMIQKLLSYFIVSKNSYFCIRIENPVYFCVSFFAITISGKVAFLGEKEQEDFEFMEEVTEDIIQKLLVSSEMSSFPQWCDSDKMSVIAQSSGTTSISKGVMLSQKNLLSDTFAGMQFYGYPQGAIYYNVLPYYHLFGIVADMLGPLYSGSTICFSDNKLNFFKDIQKFKPTNMNLPPAMIYTIERMVDKTNDVITVTGGRLKKIMCAGAHINESSIDKLRNVGIMVYVAYGLTECSPCISMNSEFSSKVGSVGKILPCCEVSIIDGEIAVRGEIVMLGYWKDMISTNNTIRDGWLYTGDLGYLDDEGFLFLTGRKSNIIVFEDGKKIIPEMIEAELNEINNVEECLISKFQVDNRVNVNVTAVISCENKNEILQQIKCCLHKYGISNRVENVILTTEQLPKNKLGKIIRK